MDVCKECEKKFQKSTYYSLDYLQVVEEMFKKCDMKEFELFVNIWKKIWFRRYSRFMVGNLVRLILLCVGHLSL